MQHSDERVALGEEILVQKVLARNRYLDARYRTRGGDAGLKRLHPLVAEGEEEEEKVEFVQAITRRA